MILIYECSAVPYRRLAFHYMEKKTHIKKIPKRSSTDRIIQKTWLFATIKLQKKELAERDAAAVKKDKINRLTKRSMYASEASS